MALSEVLVPESKAAAAAARTDLVATALEVGDRSTKENRAVPI